MDQPDIRYRPFTPPAFRTVLSDHDTLTARGTPIRSVEDIPEGPVGDRLRQLVPMFDRSDAGMENAMLRMMADGELELMEDGAIRLTTRVRS